MISGLLAYKGRKSNLPLDLELFPYLSLHFKAGAYLFVLTRTVYAVLLYKRYVLWPFPEVYFAVQSHCPARVITHFSQCIRAIEQQAPVQIMQSCI